MARDNTTQRSARVEVDTDYKASGLVVAAKETTSPIPHRNYNPQVSADVLLLTQALSSFVPALASKARDQAINKQKTDVQAGIAYAKTATEEQLNNFEAFSKLQTPEFLMGFEHTNGSARAVELGAQLEAEYDQVKDQLVTPGQYDKWMSGHLNGALEGVDSPHFTQGFLETIARTDDKLREDSITNNYVNIQQSAMADLMTATKGNMVSKMQAGDDTWTDDLQFMRDKGRLDGISHKQINEMQFELVEEVAIATGRPELFDAAFGQATPDSDNPDKMIPPLASTPKWSGRIADSKLRAEAVARSKTSQKDEVAKLGHYKKIESEMGNGNFAKAGELADAGVASGLYRSEKAMEYHGKIKTARELAIAKDGIDKAFAFGAYHLAPQVPGYTPKLEQEVVSKRSDERFAAAGDDPIKLEQALEQDILDMRNSGVVIPKYSEPFEYTASSRNGFIGAHELAVKMDSISPGASHNLMKADVAIQHDYFQAMLDEGLDADEALARTREAATPEKRESAARQMGFKRVEMEELVTELAIDEAYTNGWNKDAIDTAYVQNVVWKTAQNHLMGSGEHADPIRSIEWAAERFKNTHTAMLIPGTSDAFYLEHNGTPFPEEMSAAITYVSDKLVEDFKDDPVNADETGYYPLKLPDGSYAMHHASGPRKDLPVMGKNGPWRVEPQQLMHEYLRRDMMSIDEMHAKHEQELADQQAEQEARDKAQQRYRDQLQENRDKFERSKKRKRP